MKTEKQYQLRKTINNIRVIPRVYPRQSASTGFTLIEILVAIAIFSMAILVAVGMLNQTMKAQRKALASQELIDGARFAMESISKAVRMSKIQTSIDGSSLVLGHPNKGIITYDLALGRIQEGGIPLTSNKINVEKLWFNVEGVGAGDVLQPRVTIIIKAKDIKGLSEINLQTTVSQRELDI